MAMSYPNPFRPGDQIWLAAPAASAAVLTVHDLEGAVVMRVNLSSSNAEGGRAVTWDGRTDAGQALPGGTYFARLEAGGTQVTRKLLLLGGAR